MSILLHRRGIIQVVTGGGAVSNISLVGSVNNGNGTAITIPTGAIANDFALCGAGRVVDGTVPSVPGGWTAPSPSGTIDVDHSGTCGGVTVYQFSATDGASTGTFTNANSVLCGVYRGVRLTNPILAMKFASGNTSAITFPALAFTSTTAWVACGGGMAALKPHSARGSTERVNSSTRGWLDTNGPVSSFSGESMALSTARTWIACAVAFSPPNHLPKTKTVT